MNAYANSRPYGLCSGRIYATRNGFYDASGMGIPEAKEHRHFLMAMHRRKIGLAKDRQLDYIKKVNDQD